jgi:MFS family permease
MPAERAIRDAIKEYNSDLLVRAWVALGMGIATSLAVLGLILLTSFWMLFFVTRWWLGFGVAAFLVFMVASVWAVRRGYEPEQEAGDISTVDVSMAILTFAATGMVTSPRHAVAGFAGIVMHGPACLLESLHLRRALLRSDDQTVRDAAMLLERAPGGGAVSIDARTGPLPAALVLVKLRFLRPEASLTHGHALASRPEGAPPAPATSLRLVLTEKGKDAAIGTRR